MKKLSTVLILGFALMNLNLTFAADQKKDAAASYDAAVKEYDFESNSYNVSDDQLQNSIVNEDLIQKDQKQSFWAKVVNSSHFSSKTATKTWIPVNKAE